MRRTWEQLHSSEGMANEKRTVVFRPVSCPLVECVPRNQGNGPARISGRSYHCWMAISRLFDQRDCAQPISRIHPVGRLLAALGQYRWSPRELAAMRRNGRRVQRYRMAGEGTLRLLAISG